MHRFKKFLLQVFSTRAASIICFIVAIFGKLSLLKYYYILDNDRIYQVIAARNWLRSLGFTINSVHVNNLSREVFEPLHGYPTGYSALLVPLFSIFHDFEIACLFLDFLSGFLFLIVLRNLLVIIEIPIYLINYSILFFGFTIPVYITYSTPTDLLSLAMCLLSLYLCIRFSGNTNRFILYGLMMGIVNVLLGTLRYMYVPILFVLPLFLIWNGYRKYNKALSYAGWICLIVTVTGILYLSGGLLRIAELFLSGKSYSGNSTHVYEASKGLYPENLLQFYPFASEAFINTNFVCTQLAIRTLKDFTWWISLLRIVCLPLQVAFLFFVLIFIYRRKGLATEPRAIFITVGGMLCIILIAVLFYLSFTKPGYVPPPVDRYWTYIGEGRYYAFVHIFLYTTFLLWWVFAERSGFKLIRKVAICLFLLFTGTDLLHGIRYVGKITYQYRLENPKYVHFDSTRNFIRSQIAAYKMGDVVVTSMHGAPAGYAILDGGKTMFNIDEIIKGEFNSDQPTILIAVIEKRRIKHFTHFLKKKGTSLICIIGDFYLYAYYVNPH